MKKFKVILLFSTFLLILFPAYSQEKFITPFEKSQGQKTTTYSECIDFCKRLAEEYESIHIQEIGMTDSGLPLHIVLYNANMEFDFQNAAYLKVLIINAIHPGEPAGVDASMILLRDLASGVVLHTASKNILLAVIPIYNVGGALERGSLSRSNQNGPEEYGFRGNAKNLDLNRDFIKLDSKNARSFVQWFQIFDPEIFIDTHTSNGADYQYIITCLETHPDKLGGELGIFQDKIFTPSLFESMANKGYEMCPFVNIYRETPNHGYNQFFDYPRFSTGYTALFQTLGYMSEAHMLKPFKERVEATFAFLSSLIETGNKHRETIKMKRIQDRVDVQEKKELTLTWEIDKETFDSISFKGYQAHYKKSTLTGAERLYYDHQQPYDVKIPYYNKLIPENIITSPTAYVIRQAWDQVIRNLQANNIIFTRFQKDTLMEVEIYYIDNFNTYQSAYEGHYLHYKTTIKSMRIKKIIRKGDYFVSTKQPGIRYLMEVLEPVAYDSFFNWNYFDSILQQKEHFSDYIFEETAEKIINENTWLKDSLAYKKHTDENFRNDSWLQLNYIYTHSDYFEKGYRQYPVYRILK